MSGELGGRRFAAPEGDATRPTGERVREATFNALESLGAVAGARVLDPFAGSGALGIEALSRGAAQARFVERDRGAAAVLAANVEALGLGDRAQVVVGDARSAMGSDLPWDLVLLDPPYAADRWVDLLEAVASVLAPDGVVVIESDREVPVPGSLEVIRSKTYGGTVVQFATLAGAPS
ncbi:MAG: 16S rRNA (guanine(966)-N(2))-methyltransferase RsmD [Acidimicrobiales bacterium]|nr:16S rRNA (guanine(966)-N(2))-methyltransferase RsmD [Acidimicrobiales bacterium]